MLGALKAPLLDNQESVDSSTPSPWQVNSEVQVPCCLPEFPSGIELELLSRQRT